MIALFFLQVFIPPSTAAQSLSPPQLLGCWRQEAPRRIDEDYVAFSVLCFRRDGSVRFVSIAREGGEELLDWQFIIPKNHLVIDGQTCVVTDASEMVLGLARCLYMGAWIRDCRVKTEDRTGCKDQD